jgi:hypothetical protein
MQSPQTYSFTQNPLRLTDEELLHPETVLNHYFELFGPGETSDILAAVQAEALTNRESPYGCVKERMKVLSCFTQLHRVVEAAFIISQKSHAG